MGAEGFATFTWEGWLFGIMLLKKPWGPPEFTSYISLPSLWSVVLLAIQGFGMYLVVPNITVFNTPVTNNALVSYINPATMLAVYLINILTRIIFITGAKDIAKVLNHFYSYKSPQNEGSTRRGWLWLYAMKILTLLIALVYAGTTFELYSGPLMEDPQFGRVVGKVPGVIIGATTFFLTEVPALLGFFLVASTVLHLMEEYQDFCTALQDEVSNRASCSISIFGDDRKKRNPLVDETLSQYYLKKLDDLEGLFEAADVFLSPLSLLLVTGSVVLLIPIAYAVASMDADTPTKTVLLKTTLILQFIRYSILLITVRVGEYAKNVAS